MSEDVKDICLEWKCAGTLNIFNDTILDKKGIYMFIYKNDFEYKRIIYVGESRQVLNRVNDHKKHMVEGAFSIFKTDKDEDIYQFMIDNDYINKTNNDLRTEFLQKVKNKELWIPGNKESLVKNIWDDNLTFDKFKSNNNEIIGNYQNNISVWVAEVPIYYNYKLIESKIQKSLKQKHNIGYYNKSQSWLGREECKDVEVQKINIYNRVGINEINDFDADTQELFRNGFPINKIVV